MKPTRILLTLLMVLFMAMAGAGCAGKQNAAADAPEPTGMSQPADTEMAAGPSGDKDESLESKKASEPAEPMSETMEPAKASDAAEAMSETTEADAAADNAGSTTETVGADDGAGAVGFMDEKEGAAVSDEDEAAFLEDYDEELSNEPLVADPFEPLNRGIFWFNDVLYNMVDPLTEAYRTVFPNEVRNLITNFYYNLSTPVRFVSDILQGEITDAFWELSRVAINSTVGFLGFADAATEFQIPKPSDEDLGQTMGVWGMGHGFYLVLPFLGPSSARDAVGTAGGYFLDPLTYYPEEWRYQWGLKAGRIFHEASNILPSYFDLKDSAVDPYVAVRNFYIQLRNKQVAE